MSYHSKLMATEIKTAGWLNTNQPLSLQKLRGKIVVIHAFQMLCPACVSHGLPQAGAIEQLYPADQLQLIGLHSVFENHGVMTADALKVFLSEYRIRFPVAIDMPADDGPIPLTMQDYQLKGTPSLILIDRAGELRFNHFGRLSDMQVGSMLGQLLNDRELTGVANNDETQLSQHCPLQD